MLWREHADQGRNKPGRLPFWRKPNDVLTEVNSTVIDDGFLKREMQSINITLNSLYFQLVTG